MVTLKVGVEELSRVLASAGKCVDAKPLIPIMASVMFSKNDNDFIIVGCSSEMRIELPIKMTVEEGEFKSFCVNHAKISSGIMTLPKDSEIKLVIDENKLIVSYNTGKFVLPIDDAKDFPIETEKDTADLFEFECDGAMLIRNVDLAKLCVSTDNLRPFLCSALLDINNDNMNIVSTNGLAMYLDSKETIDVKGEMTNKQLLIPSSALSAVTGIFGDSDILELQTDAKRLFISDKNGVKFSVRMPEGAYPNYLMLLQQSEFKSIKVNKNALDVVLRRAAIFANANSHLVVLTYKNGYLYIKSEDVDFSTSINEKLPILNTTNLEDDFSIGCSLVYINSLLSAVDSENVIFNFDIPSKAFTISEDDEFSKKTLLLMPMAI